MSIVRSATRRMAEQKGQAIILFVFIFTIILAIGAISVDFGIWFSERRGAQTDSDLISLAGAYELIDITATFAHVDVATQNSSIDNDVDPFADLQNLQVRSLEFPDGYETVPDYCHTAPDTGGRLNTVVLDVEHDSRALFAGIFGIAAPDIGAHACARAGSLVSTQGLKPWAISVNHPDCFSDGVPQFGAECFFRLDDVPLTGAIRIGPDEDDDCDDGQGGSVYGENILEGSGAVCAIGDLVRSEPGNITAQTWNSVRDMIAGEGECDALNGDGDGIDQFDESYSTAIGVPGPDEVFSARDCITPRAITIIVLEDAPTGTSDYQPIYGFAAFFVIRCETTGGGTITEYEDCDIPNNERSSARLYGKFMRVLEFEGEIGAFNPFGTNVIRLAE
ncbi:MAG: Tad domain-containing protein [Chloroflexi bacterium]|nr:Tad domain-containing protein [Chloroflexota bacterium]